MARATVVGRWWTMVALGATLHAGCGETESATSPQEAAAAARAQEGVGGRISAVTGPGGVRSSSLAEGTFLGPDARIEPGQDLHTPRGTLAEVALDGGARLRLNEQTQLALPGGDHPQAVQLRQGEVVALATESAPVAVAAGEETLRILTGEAQIRHAGATRRYAVVHGQAVLEADGRSFELGAGESLQTPLPKTQPETQPELSLRPLDETGWARTFDTAARMADAVPRGIGSLTARAAGSQNERQKLRLTDQRVTVNISGRMAHTEVEQAFFNEAPAVMEGIYRFPIPSDATVSGLGLLVGNEWMRGEIVEKERGRRIFQQIVDATIPRDPALLEWERGNVFKLRVFPIPGRGDRRVRLSYTQVLPVVGGKLRYRFPLAGTGATEAPIDHFAFTVNVDARELDSRQLNDLSTPMLALERHDERDRVQLRTERERFLPTFDLGVDVPVPEETAQVHAATHLDQDGQAYFMVTLQPSFDLQADERPVHYALVLDRSHSTSPELWTTARGVVDALTEMMDAGDRFTVLACDTACDEHPGGLQAPSRTVLDEAQAFLRGQDLAGASDIGGMLAQGHEALTRGGEDARRVVVYLGDGSPSSGEMAADGLHALVRDALPQTRVLAVALGARSDLTTLGAVVEATGGDLVRADARDDLRALVRELRLRSEVPAATDVRFELPDGMAAVREQNVAALRSGDTVVLAGKLKHPVAGDITLRAQGPRGPVEARFPVELSARAGDSRGVSSHLPRTWAALQIQHLTKTQGYDAHDEIVDLSKDYTVLSRYTSLIVLENDAMYREFNVVRQAKNKDAWDGSLSARLGEETSTTRTETKKSEDGEAPTSGLIRGASSSSPAREPEPVEEEEASERSKRDQPTAGADDRRDENLGGVEQQDERRPSPDPFPATPPPPPGFFGDDAGGENESPADEPAVDVLEDFDDDLGVSGTGEGGGGSFPSAEPKPDKKAKSRRSSAPKSSSSTGSIGWTEGPGVGGRGRHWHRQRVRRLQIRDASPISEKVRSKIAELEAVVRANATQRSAHRKLVRAATRAGHPDVLRFAQAWAEADPDHFGALEALADAMAATGDPLALRTYESTLEVRPFSDSQHLALAEAYDQKGDLRRACSHRRALVSIDPSKLDHHAGLLACLHGDGRIAEASRVRESFAQRGEPTPEQAADRSRQLEQAAARIGVSLHRGAELRAEVTWAGDADLDIAVVDARGVRLSSMHPDRRVRVQESRGRETLTLRRVSSPVFVEVTRNGSLVEEGLAEPVRGTLELKTPHGKKTVSFELREGTQRLAAVRWIQRWR